jgi:uncharacterized SAM-binding protein YcdF (DUF218 family)
MTHLAGGVAAQPTAADTRPAAAARRRRRARQLLAAVLALAIAAPLLWRPALRGLGAALIAEDDLAPADVLVVSSSSTAVDAFEAAALYRGGYAARVLVPGTAVDPHLQDLRSLGIPYLSSSELARAVLERSGVPAAAIEIGSATIDGTETESAALAPDVARQRPRRLLVITARSHTARTRWLLRRLLSAETVVMVRSAGDDAYAADTWWQSRSEARETLMECVRWINTLLGDLWS